MAGDPFSQIEKSVFIVTYGRTGSTVLQNMLNKLPGYLVRGENANLLAPLVRAWRDLHYSDLARKMRDASREWWDGRPSSPTQPWFGYEAIDSDAFGRDLAEVFVRDALRAGPDTRAVGFKEIRWHEEAELFPFMLEFLQRYMPGEVKIIFNTRDHEEVLQSGWWKTRKREKALPELQLAEELYAAWQAEHPDQYATLRYNDFISGPEAWRPLFTYLEEPFDPDLVQEVLDRKLMHMKIPARQNSGW